MSRTTLLVAPVSCLSGFLEVDTAGGADGATVAGVAGGASARFCLALLIDAVTDLLVGGDVV